MGDLDFLTNVYVTSDKPTFFELQAKDRLQSSLQNAATFFHKIISARYAALQVLEYKTGVNAKIFFHFLIVLLDLHHLTKHNATWAEHFFSLKSTLFKDSKNMTAIEKVELLKEKADYQMPTMIKILVAVVNTLLPLLEAHYESEKAAVRAEVAGGRYRAYSEGKEIDEEQEKEELVKDQEGGGSEDSCVTYFGTASTTTPVSQLIQDIKKKIIVLLFRYHHWWKYYFWRRVFLFRIFPLFLKARSYIQFFYRMRFLLDEDFKFYGVMQHLLGLEIVRQQPAAAMRPDDEEKANEEAMEGILDVIKHQLSKLPQKSMWVGLYALQFLGWFYQREDQLTAGTTTNSMIPVSPPEKPCNYAIAIPKNEEICPLCSKKKKNIAQSKGGFTFCYGCLVKAVNAKGCCPVTKVPMGVEHIRRLILV